MSQEDLEMEFRRAMNPTLEPRDLVTVESTGELIWTVVTVPAEQAESIDDHR